ncbi:resolvase-like protein [Tritonibacter scottomollicae]|uniref:Resolvase-like protein n=1 Tax=Tritonibacter scottomollicae TaxID=483013 RepID=A0A2T1A578_TRISK|nr:resolvase-like protein [Tritonibacter scottomollicae]
MEAKGTFFRSFQDLIDTSTQGKFTLQVLGVVAEFERALIRERTKAGLAPARDEGCVGGNTGLRTKDPAALRKVRLTRQDGYVVRLNETAQDWVRHVRDYGRIWPGRTFCGLSMASAARMPLDTKSIAPRREGIFERRILAQPSAWPTRANKGRARLPPEVCSSKISAHPADCRATDWGRES